jgi:hypothetical protein
MGGPMAKTMTGSYDDREAAKLTILERLTMRRDCGTEVQYSLE